MYAILVSCGREATGGREPDSIMLCFYKGGMAGEVATVEELRTQIRLATEVAEARQRIIYRGRVLKVGQLLSTYGLEDGSILHMVERPLDAPEMSSEQPHPQRGPFPRAGMMFHSLEVDPNMGPLSMAGQVTQSLMGAFSHLFGQDAQSGASGPITGPSQSAEAAPNSSTHSTTPPRVNSRPSRRIADAGGTGEHYIFRTETKRALLSLSAELRRICTFSDGADIFPLEHPFSVLKPPLTDIDDAELISNLQSFESAYLMLASGCRELHEGMSRGILAQDQLYNLAAILQEIPLLMIVQRRLLSTLRARPNGQFEIPATMDMPGILNHVNNPSEGTPGEPSE
ncbi:Ubiquilin [Paramicrosporidium saccamoebae]|uniref:Ubiquilin n=1 Tax=Paramicrosporidium saccamoebae TaxID=1246581 RepID=A0A2H9TGR0_9FUNG|nr:Ubiquilin [Paramicrosporidium saccamoebae]